MLVIPADETAGMRAKAGEHAIGELPSRIRFLVSIAVERESSDEDARGIESERTFRDAIERRQRLARAGQQGQRERDLRGGQHARDRVDGPELVSRPP